MRLEIKIVNNFKDDYIDSIYDTYCSVGWFNKDEKLLIFHTRCQSNECKRKTSKNY